jgi:tRNA pseudouridine13 synthase
MQDIKYTKSSNNFFVKEEPLYPFSNNGEYIIALIKKENIDTWNMCQIISEYIGVKIKEIGYCGLKDKDATSTQYISIPKSYQEKLEKFSHENIQILSITKHENKLKIGHLKGNHFTILLNETNIFDILKTRCEIISQYGMANYFGYQRFGRDRENYIIGRDIVEGKKRIREKHKSKFFISAYQSYLFNNWLNDRINFSKTTKEEKYTKQPHPFKMLDGEVFLHYPYGRIFSSEDLDIQATRFYEKDISITGLIAGEKITKSTNEAYNIEKNIDIINKQTSSLPTKQMLGARRFAWIFPDNLTITKEENTIKLDFFLPKGSYATVLLEQLGLNITKE